MTTPLPAWLSEADGSTTLQLLIQPRAGSTKVVGEQGDALKIRVAGAPVDGAANATLVRFLAKELGVRSRDIEIIAGSTGRRKLVRVEGVPATDVAARLSQ